MSRGGVAVALARIGRDAKLFGIDFARLARSVWGLPAYFRDFRRLTAQMGRPDPLFPIKALYPCLTDRFQSAGSVAGHYFYQDWYVASRIFAHAPKKHVDVGSRVDGFVSHVACFREIEIFDIRPLALEVPNIKFRQVDFMQPQVDLDGYCDSISSLHAIEHFGLGRYGDRVDHQGHLVGLDNIWRVLRPGGRFYFSVPIGDQRIEFNAHRVFSVAHLLELVRDRYRIDSFAFVDDRNRFFPDVSLKAGDVANNCGCRYGCGIFTLTKT